MSSVVFAWFGDPQLNWPWLPRNHPTLYSVCRRTSKPSAYLPVTSGSGAVLAANLGSQLSPKSGITPFAPSCRFQYHRCLCGAFQPHTPSVPRRSRVRTQNVVPGAQAHRSFRYCERPCHNQRSNSRRPAADQQSRAAQLVDWLCLTGHGSALRRESERCEILGVVPRSENREDPSSTRWPTRLRLAEHREERQARDREPDGEDWGWCDHCRACRRKAGSKVSRATT
jgi:hypothetical protein